MLDKYADGERKTAQFVVRLGALLAKTGRLGKERNNAWRRTGRFLFDEFLIRDTWSLRCAPAFFQRSCR